VAALAKQHVEPTIQLQSTNLRACETGSTLRSRRGSPPLRDCWAEGRGTDHHPPGATPRRPFPPQSLTLDCGAPSLIPCVVFPVWSPAYVFPFREANVVVGLLQGRRGLGQATHTGPPLPLRLARVHSLDRAPPPHAPRRLILPLSRSANHRTRARTNRRTHTE
jgi:hypothetical protein